MDDADGFVLIYLTLSLKVEVQRYIFKTLTKIVNDS